MDPTDKKWEILQPLLPKLPRRTDGRGRPWADNRKLLNGMLWVLRTGTQWQDLAGRYGTKSTCHRRFQPWVDSGVFERILHALAQDLQERGGLDLSECFVDATLASAKKRDPASAPPARAKAARSWQWQTALVFLSPFTLNLLRQQKPGLLGLYSSDALSMLSWSD